MAALRFLRWPPIHKAVRFITQPLQIVQNRTLVIEAEGFLTGHVEMLPSRVAVRSLGDADSATSSTPRSAKTWQAT